MRDCTAVTRCEPRGALGRARLVGVLARRAELADADGARARELARGAGRARYTVVATMPC